MRPEAPYITFIIPSKGRETLNRTINSIFSQTIKDFEIIVVFDGVKVENRIEDDRILYLEAPLTKSPGLTRNYAFKYVRSKWIGFVDDDDLIYDKYIEELKKEDKYNPLLGFVLFRLITTKITPSLDIIDKIVFNETGISFAVKTRVVNESKLTFNPKGSEDFAFLDGLVKKGYIFKISDYVAYEVCRNNSDKGRT
jgi:glycosyltransferase involved in cell wall biosynthesis